jgi:hypothetical protein
MRKSFFFFAALPVAVISVVFAASAQAYVAPPTNPTASVVSACAVQLDWSQSTNVDNFKFSKNSSGFSVIPGLTGSGAKSFVHSELTPGTAYAYKLRSCVLASGECSDSVNATPAPVTTMVLQAAPAVPTGLSVASNDTQGSVTLQWTPAATPAYSGFRLYRSDGGGAFNPIATFGIDVFTTNGNTYPDPVDSSVTRIYKVKTWQSAQACTAVDNSTLETAAWVNFSGFTPPITVPAWPASVSVLSFAVQAGGTQAQFGWDASPSADSYDFQVAEDSAFTVGLKDYPSLTATKSAFINFGENQNFYYRVRACSGSNCSAFRPGAAPYHSGNVGPTNLSYVLVSGSGGTADVNLSWNDTAEDYKHNTVVYRKLSTDADYPATPYRTLAPVNCGGVPETCDYVGNLTDAGVAAGDLIYKYKLVFVNTADGSAGLPGEITVDMKTVSIKNWGWAGWGNAGQKLGIGWIRTSFDAVFSAWENSTQAADSAHPYNVSVDRDGNLHGYAWTNSYGWLSFDPPDLNDCPSGPPCAPTVDNATGKVSGWAKFLSADPLKGAWTGWVKLRGVVTAAVGAEYGLCYGNSVDANGAACSGDGSDSNNKLSGFAWGSDVTGWMTFDDLGGGVTPVVHSIKISPLSAVVSLGETAQFTADMQGFNDSNSVVWTLRDYNTGAAVSGVAYGSIGTPVGSQLGAGHHQSVVTYTAPNNVGTFPLNMKIRAVKDTTVSALDQNIKVVEPYGFTCTATNDKVTLGWQPQATLTRAHKLEIYGTNTAADLGNASTKLMTSPASGWLSVGTGGSYAHTGLTPETTYYYRLRVIYQGGSSSDVLTDINCQTIKSDPLSPSKLNVWSLSPSELYLNWKDNTVRDHDFTIERIKLTPKQPKFDDRPGTNAPAGYADILGNQLKRDRAETMSADTLAVFWTNDTNNPVSGGGPCVGDNSSTNCKKGPFFHRLERINRRPTDTFAPTGNPFTIFDANGDGRITPTENATYAEIDRSFPEDITVAQRNRTDYEAQDSGLAEGTEYYYRVRACSFFKVDLSKSATYNHNPDTVVCSPVEDNYAFVATTTLPATPTVPASGSMFTSVGHQSINIAWTDRSAKEDGYDVTIDTCSATPAPTSCVGGTVGHYLSGAMAGTGTSGSMNFGNLDYGTAYTITVQAYKNSILGNGRIFSAPLTDSRVTTPVLVTESGDGGASFTPNCPAYTPSCFYPYTFSNNTGFSPATVTFNGYSDSDHFDYLGFNCAGTFISPPANSCSLTMNGRKDITPSFRRTHYDYSVSKVGFCQTPSNPAAPVSNVSSLCENYPIAETFTCPAAPSGCRVIGCVPGQTIYCNEDVNISIIQFAYIYTLSTAGFCQTPSNPAAPTSNVSSVCHNYPTVDTFTCPTAPSGCQVTGCTPGQTIYCNADINISVSKIPAPAGAPMLKSFAMNAGQTGPASRAAGLLPPVFAENNGGWFGSVKAAANGAYAYLTSLFGRLDEVSAAVGDPVYPLVNMSPMPTLTQDEANKYFKQSITQAPRINYPSAYLNAGLEPDTVYLYRVKAIYADSTETAYSIEGAGRTLPGGGTVTPIAGGINICTRNSFCQFGMAANTYTVSGVIYDPRTTDGYLGLQCHSNDDCRDVGTSRQVFEEVKP